MIYFDYAATSPMFQEAIDIWVEVSKSYYGNTESLHDVGHKSKELLEHCRRTLANLLQVPDNTIYFTSGGSESNDLALQVLIQTLKKDQTHIISTGGEHSSIKNNLPMLERHGYTVTEIPFTTDGIVDVCELQKQIKPETGLVIVQHVNSEIGTIQPLQEIHDLLKDREIRLHSDCVQSFGKLDIAEIIPYVDSVSISSHKINGPKGIGALYIADRYQVKPLIPGTVHEKGLRPGTVNLPAVASFTQAAALWKEQRLTLQDTFITYRHYLESELEKVKESIQIFGSSDQKCQLPSIFSFRIKGLEGQYVLLELNQRGLAVSSGSACHIGKQAPSPTVLACQYNETIAKGLVRVSMGAQTTQTEVEKLSTAIIEIVQKNNT
ncbi:IscS subfamily cysteine desulfurase [Bacillus carboniphilus]|uniref:IscS subfamily cysteine desulfurase n=1 Tax=Bacillus carboniphilus TaxID=86663 RepID=A0ABP3G730_9BACI